MVCHHLKSGQNSVDIHDSIVEIDREIWDAEELGSDIYLSHAYLKALEETLRADIQFRYICFYDANGNVDGKAYLQLLRFTPDELNVDALEEQFGHTVPEKFIRNLDAKVMLCGNAFATGEHGYSFLDPESPECLNRLCDVLHQVKKDEKKANNAVSLVLLKDYWPDHWSDVSEPLKSNRFHPFEIDVNMVVDLLPEWNTFEDYLNALTTKFRTKFKAILHRSESLVRMDYSEQDIQQNIEVLERLYNNVVEKADYRFAALTANTLLELKRQFPEHFKVFVYQDNGKSVGFSTSFTNNRILDANFVGIDYDVNRQYAVYQRMLVDLIEYGINKNVKSVQLGRTAEEIKSTLGAEPVHMRLFAKHRNPFTNQLVKPVLQHVKPREFKIRKPFKATHYEN